MMLSIISDFLATTVVQKPIGEQSVVVGDNEASAGQRRKIRLVYILAPSTHGGHGNASWYLPLISALRWLGTSSWSPFVRSHCDTVISIQDGPKSL